MRKEIIPNFWDMHKELKEYIDKQTEFNNNDEMLKREAQRIIDNRKYIGLDGLVGDLEAIVINTEEENMVSAVDEFFKFTGYDFKEGFKNKDEKVFVLEQELSPYIVIKSRDVSENPYKDLNNHPKTEHQPNTRIEAFLFSTKDIKKYYDIQNSRGIQFMNDGIIEKDNYYMLLTIPSSFTNTSYGVIQWKSEEKSLSQKDYENIDLNIKKGTDPYLKNIKAIDHIATRINSKDRDAAILEFMEVTNYNFEFSMYITDMNSITNVSRLPNGRVAMVFTAGIAPMVSVDEAGPTEKFVYNYGARPHHIAYVLEDIQNSFEKLKENGMRFLIDLVGEPKEGIIQTFSYPSKNTFVVNEYIYRYGDFDGFFTKDNVADLTASTAKQ